MSRITVKEALRLVGDRVGKDPVVNRDDILFLIDRAQEAAYNKGTWWGMFKEMSIVSHNGEIHLPWPYTNLVAVNVNGVPKLKRGIHHEFHQNGYGSKRDCYNRTRGCRWNESVIEGGELAVPWQPTARRLHIRCRSKEKPDTKLTISGSDSDGVVHTYIYDEEEAKNANVIGRRLGECQVCSTVDESDKIKYTKTIFGEVIPLEGTDSIIETETVFDRIDSIQKDPTLGPVDIFVDMGKEAIKLLTMEPEQTESVFRRWVLPDTCCDRQCVHVLAKLGEPAPVSHDSQPLMIRSKLALLYMCMSMHHEFNKLEPQLAEAYLAKGLLALDEQNDQNTTHNVTPIQVVTPQISADHLYGRTN